MNFDYDRALARIKRLTVLAGVAGAAAMAIMRGMEPAAGFLAGAVISLLNFQGLCKLSGVLGGSPGGAARGWAVLIALRYVVVGAAVYVIVRVLGITPLAVLVGLLAVFAAVLLEILYELILYART